jgi:hypothetical protein
VTIYIIKKKNRSIVHFLYNHYLIYICMFSLSITDVTFFFYFSSVSHSVGRNRCYICLEFNFLIIEGRVCVLCSQKVRPNEKRTNEESNNNKQKKRWCVRALAMFTRSWFFVYRTRWRAMLPLFFSFSSLLSLYWLIVSRSVHT